MDDSGLLASIERQYHAALGSGSLVTPVGSFRVHVWPEPHVFYRHAAVPVARSPHWPSAIAGMRAVFGRLGRNGRLEFIGERWPGLAEAAAGTGLRLEGQARLMALGRDSWRKAPPCDGPACTMPDASAPDSLLDQWLAGTETAFGMAGTAIDPRERRQLRADLKAGSVLLAAVMEDGTMIAGGALAGLEPVGHGPAGEGRCARPAPSPRDAGASGICRTGCCAEMTGIWSAPHRRRQGLARMLCDALLERFFANGNELVWLTASNDAAHALYRGLGFRDCGSHYTFSVPALPPADTTPGRDRARE